MKPLRLLIVSVSLCLCNAVSALSPPEIFSQLGASVVVLETYDDRGQRLGSYSATVIQPETLVTACDVLETATVVRATAKSGAFEARAIARDRERNLCVFTAPGIAASPISLRPDPVPVGGRVFAISNALALGVGISDGVVSGIRRFPGGDYIQFTAPISPGSEGGALVDESGSLVGIIDFRRRDGQNVNFASAAAWLHEVSERAAASSAKLQRFDRAMMLTKAEKWAELKAESAAWTAETPDSIDAWRFAITAARELADFEAELQGWKEWYRLDPTSTAPGVGLGRTLMARGKAREATDLAQRLVAAHPEDAASWLLLGQARLSSGQPGEAEQAYARTVELDPWAIDAYQGIAELAQMRGDSRTAISVWRRLSGLNANDLGFRIRLAKAYLAAGRHTQAWSTLGQIDNQDSDSPLVWYWKGVTLAQLGCPELAIEAYRKSLERKPAMVEWIWTGIGQAMTTLHRRPEAINAFRTASLADPGNDELRYQLAVSLKDGGRVSEALKITTDLVTTKPEEVKNWRQHGFVLSVLGRPAEAIPALERSLQLDAKQAKVWAALIEAYQVAGRREDAKRAYEKLRGVDGLMAKEAYRAAILPYEEGAQ